MDRQEINVRVLFFAKARELSRLDETYLQVKRSITAKDLLDCICDQFHLETIKDNLILACNQEYCEHSTRLELKEGDEIAIIPPISGG